MYCNTYRSAAEKQLTKRLRKFAKKAASSDELIEALDSHLEETMDRSNASSKYLRC